MTRRRLDLELVRRGLAGSRTEALSLIASGRVRVGGTPAVGHRRLVAAQESVSVARPPRRYASRGGDKLAGALDAFRVDPGGKRCLDAGAATGGFTDVLLSRGAAHVVAVDVSYGELAWRLRRDRRVTVLERVNVRALTSDDLPYEPELVVADLSFISLRVVVGTLVTLSSGGADLMLLVKPQFEASPEEVEPGGVVRDPHVWRRVLEGVGEAAASAGAGTLGAVGSAVRGPAGNVEFFLHARVGSPSRDVDLGAVVSGIEEAS
ncbi:MAG TPA: TlyA family RNA methyltransferase [Actinomycetota bacterium]|nr:TlyA family RNA methyltransferase [Actinomycetota bacterium]